MAFESIGLGANLRFNEGQAVSAMGRARAAFKSFSAAVKQVGAGLSQLGGAARSASLALAPLTAAVGIGGKMAATFEQQMDAVRSILIGTPTEDLTALEQEVKRLGATTQFSATQAAKGAEFLSRAGFTAQQQIAALKGTLALAAADSIDLATAANITANTVRSFGLEASDANRVADVLAITSARTNTDVIGLGESMKFAAPKARQLGMSVEETSLALGLLANAGLKGTLGGTALKNMLVKLSGPSDAMKKQFNDMGLKVQDANGNMLPFFQIVRNLHKTLPKLGGNMKQAAFLTKAFGLRGEGAAANLALAIEKMGKVGKDGRTELEALAHEIENSEGKAEKMAAIRLDNFIGQWVLLVSAVEGFAIETVGGLLPTLSKPLRSVADFIADIAVALQFINNPTKDLKKRWDGFSVTVREIAAGVSMAFTMIKSRILKVVALAKQLKERFDGLGGERIRQIAKLGTLFVTIAAAIAPVLFGLGGFAFVISTVVVPGLIALKSIFLGVASILFGPVGIAIAAVVGLIFALKRENESFGQAALRVWGMVKKTVLDFWNNVVMPFARGVQEGFMDAIRPVRNAWADAFVQIRTAVHELMAAFGMAGDTVSLDWKEIGIFIGTTISLIATIAGRVAGFMVERFRRVISIFKKVAGGIKDLFAGNILSGLKKLGSALLDSLLTPTRDIALAMVRLADALPGGEKLVPKALRTFAEKGIGAVIEARPQAQTAKEAGAALNREAERQAATAAAKGDVKVNVAAPPPSKVEVNNILRIDGREAAFAVASQSRESAERAAQKADPWQRRRAVELGAISIVGAK